MVEKDESYFSQHPTHRRMPNTDSSRTSTDLGEPPLRTPRYRQRTSPFPAVSYPQSIEVDIPMDTIENNVSTPRSEGGPNLNPRPSYADVLPQLRDNAQSAQRREKKPSSSHLTSSNNLNVVRRLLSLETARANAAEARLAKDSRNSEAILTQVLNIREAHFQAQAELLRVNTELRTYKFQLDLAHKEIRRAQIIADEADKARIKAEERCARDRENIRELLLQRAIKEAREQGRRDGWALGLERGRLNVLAMRHDQRSGNAEGTMVNQREERGRSPIPSRVIPDTMLNVWPTMHNDHVDHALSTEDARSGYDTPALSAVSQRSTRISEFDIVRPPTVEASNDHEYLSRSEQRDHYIYQTTDSQRDTSNGAVRTRSTVDIYCRATHDLENPDTGRRATIQSSTPDVTVLDMDVETPSQSPTNASPGTTVTPVLLSPNHANLVTVIQGPSEQSLSTPFASSRLNSRSSDRDSSPVTVVSLGLEYSPAPLDRPEQSLSTPVASSRLNSRSLDRDSSPVTVVSLGLEYSPAPLDRPISLFSDDDD